MDCWWPVAKVMAGVFVSSEGLSRICHHKVTQSSMNWTAQHWCWPTQYSQLCHLPLRSLCRLSTSVVTLASSPVDNSLESLKEKNSACHPELSSSMIFVGIMATIWIFSVWILKLFCIKNFLFDGYILLQPCNFRDWYSTGKVLVQYRNGVDSALINWRFNAEG